MKMPATNSNNFETQQRKQSFTRHISFRLAKTPEVGVSDWLWRMTSHMYIWQKWRHEHRRAHSATSFGIRRPLLHACLDHCSFSMYAQDLLWSILRMLEHSVLQRKLVNPREDIVVQQKQRKRWVWEAAGYEYRGERRLVRMATHLPWTGTKILPPSKKNNYQEENPEGEKTVLRVFFPVTLFFYSLFDC